MTEFKPGWEPTDKAPLVMATIVQVTVLNDLPVAVITLYDVEDETRTIHLEERAAWDLYRGLGNLLEQLHRPR